MDTEGIKFCRNIDDDIKLYNQTWFDVKNESGSRGSTVASGQFYEEIIKRQLRPFIAPKCSLLSGMAVYKDQSKRKFSPQIDLMVCKPSECDAFLEGNGLINAENINCIIEVKGVVDKNKSEPSINQISAIKKAINNNKIGYGMIWMYLSAGDASNLAKNSISKCKKEGISLGIAFTRISVSKNEEEKNGIKNKEDIYETSI